MKSVLLTDHVISHMNLDFSFRLKCHLAFNTLVGLFLGQKAQKRQNNIKTVNFTHFLGGFCLSSLIVFVKV